MLVRIQHTQNYWQILGRMPPKSDIGTYLVCRKVKEPYVIKNHPMTPAKRELSHHSNGDVGENEQVTG